MNVVPAQAGTHTEQPRSLMRRMDSRLHGNDIVSLWLSGSYAKLSKTVVEMNLRDSVGLNPRFLDHLPPLGDFRAKISGEFFLVSAERLHADGGETLTGF